MKPTNAGALQRKLAATLHAHRSLVFRTLEARGDVRRLLVLSHGVGGNETNLLPLASGAPDHTAVVLVRSPLTLGPGQHAWFPVAFTPQGPQPDLVAAEQGRQQFAEFVVEMQEEYGVPPERTVIAGFSQGGILSASLALTRPELVAGFGILAGRILPEIEPRIAPREALAHLRAFVGHGRHDTKLPVDWAHRSDSWLTALGIEHDMRLYDGDHGMPTEIQRDFMAWFERVIAASANREELP
jgi:phospholipase/carboxylesterase